MLNFQAGTTASPQSLGTTDQVLFATAPTLTNGVLMGVTVTDNTSYANNTTGYNLATYGATGVTALQIATVLPTSGGSATTNYIVTTGSTVTLAGTVAANAILIVGAAASTIALGANGLSTSEIATTGTGTISGPARLP